MLKDDLYRLSGKNASWAFIIYIYFTHYGAKAVILYRLSRFMYKHRLCFFARYLMNRNLRITGAEIHYKARIDSGLVIPHPNGIVIASGTKIGKNCTILQQVTIGVSNLTCKLCPVIGDDVILSAGSKVLGKVEIGNNSVVGANAVVLRSFGNNQTIVGIPAVSK